MRSYLRFTGRAYDIIATDCTDLRYKTNANLYDYEYFGLCKKHITDDGMVVAWMPLAGLSDEMFRLALRTFYRIFPDMTIWYMNNEPTHYILILGTKKPLKIDYALMKKKLQEPTVKADLAELYLDDADKILSCFVCDKNILEGFLAGKKVNSENRPYLEFESPKYGYGEKPLIDNLETLMSLHSSVLPYVENVPDQAAFVKRMNRYFKAIPHIIAGHEAYRELKIEDACREYMEAVRIVPEDNATLALLDFEELKLRIAAYPTDPWGYRQLGAVYFLQGRYQDAVTALAELLKRTTELPPDASKETINYYDGSIIFANKTIGKCYMKVGNPQYARPYLEKAHELQPEDTEITSLLKKAGKE